MTGNKYQDLAKRTINQELTRNELIDHSLFGMCAEIGEIQSLYQKTFQGHSFTEEHAMKEVGDLLWFIAEFCTANEFDLDVVMHMNIIKLMQRYPEGFKAENSLNRAEGDI